MVKKYKEPNFFEINGKGIEIINFYFDSFCQESLEELINHLFFQRKKNLVVTHYKAFILRT